MGFLLFLSGSVGVSPQGEPGVEVSQHGGDSLYVHTVLQRRGSKGVPLRYNYDKPEKPRISRVAGLWQGFSSFFKPKNRAAKQLYRRGCYSNDKN